MKNFKNIVLDSTPPENKNDLWLHQIDADEGEYELKLFTTVKQGNRHSQKWVTIGTGSYNPDTPTPTPPIIVDDWYVLNGVEKITDGINIPLNNPIKTVSHTIYSINKGYVYLILNLNQNLKSVISPDSGEIITDDFKPDKNIFINGKMYKVYFMEQNMDHNVTYKITITQNG